MSEDGGVRAVLFDIDGTILVTGGAGGAAWQRAFEELTGSKPTSPSTPTPA